MLLIVLLDVVQEFFALEDLDVGSKSDDKAASAFYAVDGGPEHPVAVLPLEVLFCQRKFLQQEALGASVELQGNLFVQRPRHPEDIRPRDIVLRGKLPRRVGFLDGMDTRNFYA